MAYISKRTGTEVDALLDKVENGSVVTDNTLSALDETSDNPVSGKGVAEAIEEATISTQQQLTELQTESLVVTLKGAGTAGVKREVVGIIPNTTYRLYVKGKWNTPVVEEGFAVFEIYTVNEDGTYTILFKLLNIDNLKDYYEFEISDNKRLIVYARIVEGETATFVVEKMDNTIKDLTFQRNALNTYIVGNGLAYSGARFRGLSGRTYRITLPKKWNIPDNTPEDVSAFYIGKTKDGVEEPLLSIFPSGVSELRDYYEIEAGDEDFINIGGRAIEGENIYVLIEDITDEFSFLKNSSIAGFNTQEMEMIGTYIPLKKQGYIAYGVSNFDNPIFTFNYHYEVIPCKIGDIFFVKAKGGNEARLYMLYDQDLNMITYTDADVDFSEIGTFFRCFVDGYFVVNADIRKEYKTIKINSNIQNSLSPVFDIAKYINWRSGAIRWSEGSAFDSEVNQRTGYMCTFNYNKIRLNVNVSITENVSTGIAFYDSERNYISGIQNVIGVEKRISLQEYNIPENACYFRTTLYNEYIEDFICELYYDEEDRTSTKNSIVYKNFDLNWQNGYFAHFYKGTIEQSSVNSIAEINVENYANIELTVNKTSIGASPGICFYDKNDNFIIGYPYPNFGDSAIESTYAVEKFAIPYNATKAIISFYTRYISEFHAIIYSEIAEGENTFTTLGKFANSVIDNICIGSPELYSSQNTANEYVSLNNKTIEELYEKWDSLVANYPMYIRRGEDLGEVSDSNRSYTIRQYVIGYNGRFMVDHEPSKDEIVSQTAVNHWRSKDNPRKILINNGMHGEEKTPCWGAALAFEELLSSGEKWAQFIKSNFELYIIPCLNPYGFHHCLRGNVNGIVLNRDDSRNEPEHLMYMSWVEANKDAFALIDNHGSQGRYAYIPVWAGQPIFGAVNKIATHLSASMYPLYKEFYNSIQEGYGETYSPFILAKYSYEASYGRCAVEMLDRFNMTAFALETPDNIVVNPNGVVDDSLSGLIGQNDLRCCKITKDLLINFIQAIGKLSFNKII